jgi:hypothetical protein
MTIIAQTQIPSRRGFLASLVRLPLIGGGLAVLGAPSAVALPRSEELLRRYVIFLGREQQAARIELDALRYPHHFANMGYSLHAPETWRAAPWWQEIPADDAVEALIVAAPASARAALVLSAAGVTLAP